MGPIGNRRGPDERSARLRIRDSSEGYLEAILIIHAERGHCRNVDIAEHMGVIKSSVAKALANLAQKGLVDVVFSQ